MRRLGLELTVSLALLALMIAGVRVFPGSANQQEPVYITEPCGGQAPGPAHPG